jgi:hypothetical protein
MCSSGFSVSADVHTDAYSALETVCTPLNFKNAAANRHVFRSHHKNSGQSQHQNENKSLQNVAQFKHSGMALANENCIPEEIKKDWTQTMPATIWSRICCCPIC